MRLWQATDEMSRYDTGTISGISAMDEWLRTFADQQPNGKYALTAGQNSLIVSILSAGTFLGALTAAYVADLLGRRLGLLVSTTFVFNFGVILQVAASSRPLFIAGRFFAGFGVGLISVMIPMYQSETAPKWIRGAIVGCYQFAITIGLFLAACVNYGTKNRTDTGAYRIPLAVQFAWALILMIGLVILPETPRYLIKRGRMDRAAAALARLRRLPAKHPAVQAELAEIEANHRYELSLGKAGLLDCFKGTVGKRLLTGCLLQSLQQLTGSELFPRSQ